MSSKNDMLTSKTGKHALADLKSPSRTIDEAIQTDTWSNIPVCLVKAFDSSVENQVYLEKFCNVIVSKLGYVESEMHK